MRFTYLWLCIFVFNSLVAQQITVGHGTEDFVLDTFSSKTTPRLLVSCAERREPRKYNEIRSVDISSQKVTTLLRKGEPSNLHFKPHGIDLRVINGMLKLYVISHQRPRNYVVVYHVQGDTLWFEKAIEDPLIVSPNDLCILADGSFYVCNDAKDSKTNLERLLAKRTGNVVYYDWGTNTSKVVLKKLAYANSVGVFENKVYVSCTQRKELWECSVDKDYTLKKERNILPKKGLDNIIFYKHWLITTAHPSLVKFIKHYKNPQRFSPSEVYAVNLNTKTASQLYYSNGAEISTASVGLIYKNQLYLGQVLGDFILKLPMPQLP